MRGNEANIIRKKIKKRFHYEKKLNLWSELLKIRKRYRQEKIVRQITKKRYS